MKYKQLWYIVLALLPFSAGITKPAEKNRHVISIVPHKKAAAAKAQGLRAIKFMPGLYVGTVAAKPQAPLFKTFSTEQQPDSEALPLETAPHSYEELDINTASVLLKTPDNAKAIISNWWDAGFTGKTAVIGVLDSGVPDGYETFMRQSGLQNKTMIVNRGEDSGFDKYLNGVRTPHGTGVACVYGSEQQTYLGLAHGVQTMLVTLAGDSSVDDTDWTLTLFNLDWLLTTDGQPKPTTINYSFGNGNLDQDWSVVAQTVDYIVNHYNISWVKSAGNGGWVGPNSEAPYATTMSVPADSYNAIVVANMNTTLQKIAMTLVKTSDRTQHTIQPTSSRGPTRDGRRKPDLTAPGNDTRTCAPTESVYAVPQNPTFTPYAASMQYDVASETRLVGGTSIATPHVGAATAIVYDSGIQDPMAIKALLINSADAWTDDNQQDVTAHHQVPGSHWDRTYGWGYLNMDNAFKQKDFVIQQKIRPYKTRCYQGTLAPYDKVTVVWERRIDMNEGEMHVHALTPMELEMYKEKTNAFIDDDRSTIDNVLQVSNTSTDTEKVRVTLRISREVSHLDGLDKEPFALASTRALQEIACGE